MSRTEKVRSVEVLRGLAALSVTWFHMTGTQPGWVQATGTYGWLGVEVFFVLSGFVIPLSLHASGYQTKMYGAFLLRRAIRIEIPYLASIALVVVLGYLSALAPGFRGEAQNYTALQLFAHIVYVVPFTGYDWINVVYWTLAYEFAFYLLVGLLFTTLLKQHLAITALATLAVFGAFSLLTNHMDALIFLFLMGIATFRRYVGKDSWLAFGLCVLGSAAAMIALGSTYQAIAGVATTLAILFVKFPAFKPLLWLGAISYSLYLVHTTIGGRVINLGQRFFEQEWQLFCLSIAALIISLLASWVFFVLIERPAQNAARRVSQRARRSEAPSAA